MKITVNELRQLIRESIGVEDVQVTSDMIEASLLTKPLNHLYNRLGVEVFAPFSCRAAFLVPTETLGLKMGTRPFDVMASVKRGMTGVMIDSVKLVTTPEVQNDFAYKASIAIIQHFGDKQYDEILVVPSKSNLASLLGNNLSDYYGVPVGKNVKMSKTNDKNDVRVLNSKIRQEVGIDDIDAEIERETDKTKLAKLYTKRSDAAAKILAASKNADKLKKQLQRKIASGEKPSVGADSTHWDRRHVTGLHKAELIGDAPKQVLVIDDNIDTMATLRNFALEFKRLGIKADYAAAYNIASSRK